MKEEQTGWRDQELSERHRFYGMNCPAVDIDLLLVEFNHEVPCALIEYKFKDCPPVDLSHPSYKALMWAAQKMEIPFCIVRYWRDPFAFQVFPLNLRACQHFKWAESLTEVEYVERLLQLRGLRFADEQDRILKETGFNIGQLDIETVEEFNPPEWINQTKAYLRDLHREGAGIT